jgi:hypothetical protein
MVGRLLHLAPVKALLAAAALAALAIVATPGSARAIDPGVAVDLSTWTSDNGHAYVGVRAAGQWAPPATRSDHVCSDYYSEWQLMGTPQAYYNFWWVFVHRCDDGSTVNSDSPIATHTSSESPGIGIRPTAYGDLSLYLSVAVEPVSAPARSERTVTAELTAGWRDWVDDAISAYVVRDSIRVERWTVDFGDGSRRTFPGDGSDRLATTHAYDEGTFDVIVTARVMGEAYGAFFTPAGVPYEEVVPFALDISNRASGVAALPIEYVPPVVTVGASPSGMLPDGIAVAPDDAGHAALWWPRGLHCELFVRPIIEQEGFMRSGGIVIGGATTRLVSYRYERGVNDAGDATAPGTYDAAVPIRIQWNTPLPGQQSYPVRLVLFLETTYDDGTVRTSEVSGEVAVTVIYSAVSH